jgi:hypothetical protein
MFFESKSSQYSMKRIPAEMMEMLPRLTTNAMATYSRRTSIRDLKSVTGIKIRRRSVRMFDVVPVIKLGSPIAAGHFGAGTTDLKPIISYSARLE